MTITLFAGISFLAVAILSAISSTRSKKIKELENSLSHFEKLFKEGEKLNKDLKILLKNGWQPHFDENYSPWYDLSVFVKDGIILNYDRALERIELEERLKFLKFTQDEQHLIVNNYDQINTESKMEMWRQ